MAAMDARPETIGLNLRALRLVLLELHAAGHLSGGFRLELGLEGGGVLEPRCSRLPVPDVRAELGVFQVKTKRRRNEAMRA